MTKNNPTQAGADGSPPKPPPINAAKRVEPTPMQRKIADLPRYPIPVEPEEQPEPEGELQALKATDLVEFNRLAESEFVVIASALVAKQGAMRARELCIETAARLDISIETAKRYLLKHSASIKEFCIEKGWVQLRQK